MIDAMKNEFATNFKEEYEKGEVYLLAASSASKEASDEWVKEIQEAFPGMDVVCENCRWVSAAILDRWSWHWLFLQTEKDLRKRLC